VAARPLSLQERVAEEERAERSRRQWGDRDEASPEQREMRELRRELKRLRARLGAKE